MGRHKSGDPVAPIPEEALRHREDFRRYVLDRAEAWHREHLGRLYESWDGWNAAHFEGKLRSPYILLNEPSNPRRLGDCGPISGFGGLSQIRIRPSLLRGTHPMVLRGMRDDEGLSRFAADVLLHEMIHQWAQEVSGEREQAYHGHGPAFRDHCNRIGAVLGLPPVRCSKARGSDKELESCSHWPHVVRPSNYYRGTVTCRHMPSRRRNATLEVVRQLALDALAGLTEPARVRKYLEEILSVVSTSRDVSEGESDE
jgi:hypothetical protein